jgi:acyl carrier protein
MDARENLRSFVLSLLARREEVPEFSDQDSLVTSGRIGSLEIVEMVVFLENTFHVDFAGRPFDQYDFDTIDKILELVRVGGSGT